MKRWITLADFQDTYLHSIWSSFHSLFRVLRLTGASRVLSRWNNEAHLVINWYDIPYVVEYVQRNATGDGKKPYARYMMEKYFGKDSRVRILSPGCGNGVKELQFAKLPGVEQIDAFDIAPLRIEQAKRKAADLGVNNIRFFVGDIYNLEVKERYDIMLFDGCLHHFDGLDALMDKVISYLKPDGLLIIAEFTGPNRYQFSDSHLEKCNEALSLIPASHRTFLQTSLLKKKIWAPGYLRMYLSDPSEGIRAGEILPAIRRKFEVLEEKKIGGDLLAPVLRGTVHHYLKKEASHSILDQLFAFEQKYLATLTSGQYTFGVYTPKHKRVDHFASDLVEAGAAQNR